MLRIQRLKPENFASLKVAFANIFDDSELPYFEDFQNTGPSFIGIDRTGEIQAFILVSHTPDKIAVYEISYLGVCSRYRRKGYGERLIQLVLGAVGKGGVWLNVLDSNMSGLALYKKLGFDQVSVFSTETKENGVIFVHGVHCYHCDKRVVGKDIRLERAITKVGFNSDTIDRISETIRVCWHCRTVNTH
jgi:ribosomal protein S18 acetylase RimI-like enzyme